MPFPDFDTPHTAFRIWDALLLFSMCQRPRRDSSLIDDFSKSIVEHTFGLLPKRVFPFHKVLAGKMDPINERQRTYTLDDDRDHCLVIRSNSTGILARVPQIYCKGYTKSNVLEDEAHMSILIATSRGMGIGLKDFPLHAWPVRLNIQSMRFHSFCR